MPLPRLLDARHLNWACRIVIIIGQSSTSGNTKVKGTLTQLPSPHIWSQPNRSHTWGSNSRCAGTRHQEGARSLQGIVCRAAGTKMSLFACTTCLKQRDLPTDSSRRPLLVRFTRSLRGRTSSQDRQLNRRLTPDSLSPRVIAGKSGVG